jgi:hypothetical protein
MDIKIKKEFKKTVIGFNNSGLPLGERDDLDVLAKIAQESQNPELLKLFEGELPSISKLKKVKTDKELSHVQSQVDPNTQNPANPGGADAILGT